MLAKFKTITELTRMSSSIDFRYFQTPNTTQPVQCTVTKKCLPVSCWLMPACECRDQFDIKGFSRIVPQPHRYIFIKCKIWYDFLDYVLQNISNQSFCSELWPLHCNDCNSIFSFFCFCVLVLNELGSSLSSAPAPASSLGDTQGESRNLFLVSPWETEQK